MSPEKKGAWPQARFRTGWGHSETGGIYFQLNPHGFVPQFWGLVATSRKWGSNVSESLKVLGDKVAAK